MRKRNSKIICKTLKMKKTIDILYSNEKESTKI